MYVTRSGIHACGEVVWLCGYICFGLGNSVWDQVDVWMTVWLCHRMEGWWETGLRTTCLPQAWLCSSHGTVVHIPPLSKRQQDAGFSREPPTSPTPHMWPQNRLLSWSGPRLGIRGPPPTGPYSCPGQKEKPCFSSPSEQNEGGNWRQLGPAQSGTCAWHVTEVRYQDTPPHHSSSPLQKRVLASPNRSQIPTPHPTHR